MLTPHFFHIKLKKKQVGLDNLIHHIAYVVVKCNYVVLVVYFLFCEKICWNFSDDSYKLEILAEFIYSFGKNWLYNKIELALSFHNQHQHLFSAVRFVFMWKHMRHKTVGYMAKPGQCEVGLATSCWEKQGLTVRQFCRHYWYFSSVKHRGPDFQSKMKNLFARDRDNP